MGHDVLAEIAGAQLFRTKGNQYSVLYYVAGDPKKKLVLDSLGLKGEINICKEHFDCFLLLIFDRGCIV